MKEKLKILFVIDRLGLGGTERQLVEILRRLDPSRFELFLCCLAGADSKIEEYLPEHPRITTLLLDVRSTYSISALLSLFRLVRFIRLQGIKLVQSYFLKAKFLGVLAGRLAGTKTISCTRDLGFSINVMNVLPLKLANTYTTKFLVNSCSIRQCLIQEHNIDSDKIDVINNGVDLSIYQPVSLAEKREAKQKLQIDPSHIVIGAIANLKPVKGLSNFIRAASLVHKADKKTHFVIVGEGPLRDALQGEAAALGVADNMRFAGSCSDVRPYLSAFDVGVLCSHSEGFSNAILEYMASGVPVIATAVGGNVEQLCRGETGVLVPPGDYESLAGSIRTLIVDEDLRNRISTKALQYCRKNFGMENMAKRMEDYYMQLVTVR